MAQGLTSKIRAMMQERRESSLDLLDTALLRVAGHVLFLCQRSANQWPEEASCFIVRETLKLMTSLRILRRESLLAASLFRVMIDLSIYSDIELTDIMLELDEVCSPSSMVPLMEAMFARGLGKGAHVCALLKQRCAEVISGGPRIDYTSLGDAARATLLESAACSLNLRARQVKESVKRGLAWTSDPKRHAKRQNLGQYFLISPQFENSFSGTEDSLPAEQEH